MRKHTSVLVAALFTAASAFAAIPITPTGITYYYRQNFDGLFAPNGTGNVTASPAWGDGVTLPSWYFHYTGNSSATPAGVFAGQVFSYFGSDGSVTPLLTLNSMGVAGSPDRALAMPSTTVRCEQSGIVVFHNPRPNAVDLTYIRYTGEVRRTNSTASVAESIFAYYRTAPTEAAALEITAANRTTAQALAEFPAAVATAPTAGYYITGWTPIPSARFTFSATVANTPTADSLPVNSGPLSGIRIAPGEYLAVRFSNINDSGTDALLGMDDLEMEFIERTTTISAAAGNVVRDNAGTPLVPGDDTVGFTLTVTHTGPVGDHFNAGLPGWGPAPGVYNAPVVYTGVPISVFAAGSHTVTGSVQDSRDTGVQATFQVTAPWCSLALEAGAFAYDGRGTDSTGDDTVSFDVTANGQWTGNGATLFSVIGAEPAEGELIPYGSPYRFTMPSAGQIVNFTVQDLADSACTATLTVNTPGAIGLNSLTARRPLISLPFFGTRAWTIDNQNMRLQQTASPSQTDYEVLSEVVDLTAIRGVRIVGELGAFTGNTTGFEAADHLSFEVIVDGGQPVSLLGAHDIDGNGRLDGGEAGSGSELPDAGMRNSMKLYPVDFTIPAAANSLQLRLVGNSNSASETFTLSNLQLMAENPIVAGSPLVTVKPGASAKINPRVAVDASHGGDGPLSVTGVKTRTRAGGQASMQDGWIVYDAPTDGFFGFDDIEYTMTDGQQVVIGAIRVSVAYDQNPTANIATLIPEAGGNRLAAFGIPGRWYQWQFSANLTEWYLVGKAVQCPENGKVDFLDEGPLPPTRYYRLVEWESPR